MTNIDKDIKALAKRTRNSSFNRSNYRVNIDQDRFVNSMLLHTWWKGKDMNSGRVLEDVTNDKWLKRVTPEFQRANDKWTNAMQLKFIENMLSGAAVELLLFRMNEFDDAQIIDGLQRTTAIIDFIEGKINPFGYSHSELEKYLAHFRSNLAIKIYTFNSWKDVGRFYVDMNENITHSKEDIQKAKDWFLKHKGVQL